MGIVEIILLILILIIGVFSMFDNKESPRIYKESQDNKDLARIREMKEWDRFKGKDT